MRNITTFDFTDLNKYSKIYCLVSGGIDSTYLLEVIQTFCDPQKVFPVNCWNPYEGSATLTEIEKHPNFIRIVPGIEYNYSEVLKDAFLALPKARQIRKEGKYTKKVFGCCYILKHKAFMNNPLFSEPNIVVVSGIKYSDGRQRQLWLKSLKTGITTSKGTTILNAPTFYHIHKKGQNYCYPFRDYKVRDIPEDIVTELRIKYPTLNHSGCKICPVLVLFQDRIKNEPRMKTSIAYAKQLGVY